jgi:transcriptional regulator with XRE-family HTH domain
VDTGRLIRTARREAGCSLRALAERAGTSHSTLAAYESNMKVPRADTMFRVLQAAGRRVVVVSSTELDWDDRVARGAELQAVLDLAAHFPVRHDPTLGAPRFGMVA